MKRFLPPILAMTLFACTSSKDLLLTGGFVYDNNGQFLKNAVVLSHDGKIEYVGPQSGIRRTKNLRKIDLNGAYIFPGFIDSHIHLQGYGESLDILNLVGTSSAEEIVNKVSEAVVVGTGKWIRGRGWDQNDWEEKSYPSKEILDKVAPNTPVYLRRIDGHAIWVNSTVLEIAGVDAATPDPAGGKILRDSHGEPTGIFIDNAINLITEHIPPFSREEKRAQLLNAVRMLNRMGVTSVHDPGTGAETLHILKELADSRELTIRVYAMLPGQPEQYLPYFESGPLIGYGNQHLTVRSVKGYIDGALGSRGAALKRPYNDDPENQGLLVTDPKDLDQLVADAFSHGFQVNIHAIGDRGNEICLDIFEKNMKQSPGDHRPRIEHAQIIDPVDIPRFAEIGVIPAMQPTHCTSDMPWVEARIGKDRMKGAYPWRSLIDSGSIIPGGSDAPVEYPDPLWGIYAAVTRMDHHGMPEGGWLPQEKITRIEAIKMFTEWGAYAAFEEDEKGKLEVGYLGDVVILDKNILAVPAEEILSTKVVMTIVGGEIVFSLD